MTFVEKILKNVCPHCLEGEVFTGLLSMHHECPICHHIFNRGEGYFIMSYIFNYTICGIILLPLFMFLAMAHFSAWIVMIVPLVLLVLMQPLAIRISRLAWIHMDYKARKGHEKKF